MSIHDIENHLRDIYGVDASPAIISKITDKIIPDLMEWQSRPLDAVYPIVYLDGIVYKVKKDSRIVNKCFYTVLGITMEGRKEIPGMWLTDNESASFWTSVCNELKNRGVRDILIACWDNLSGFSEAINTVFPKTEQQLCIIHQIRNSTKYVSYKDLKPIMADLKLSIKRHQKMMLFITLRNFLKNGAINIRKSLNHGKPTGLNYQHFSNTRMRSGGLFIPPMQLKDSIGCLGNIQKPRRLSHPMML